MLLICNLCHTTDDYDIVTGVVVSCTGCAAPINIPQSGHCSEEKLRSDVLENGDMVRVANRDHVWHDEIALVCGQRHIFVRIELLGRKIWVPRTWVNKI